jgi:hypothetical protein
MMSHHDSRKGPKSFSFGIFCCDAKEAARTLMYGIVFASDYPCHNIDITKILLYIQVVLVVLVHVLVQVVQQPIQTRRTRQVKQREQTHPKKPEEATIHCTSIISN